jgi:hypothetical protein
MISTSTTTINSTLYKNSYVFHKDSTGLLFSNNIGAFDMVDKFRKDEQFVLDLISKQPKVFVSMTTSLYHLYHDCIGEFLSQYEKTPEAKFLIDVTIIADMDPLPEYIKMFFRFLNDKKIDYQPIDFRKINKVNINNFYYRNKDVESLEVNGPTKRIYDFSQQYVLDKSKPATKKVFLSRKNYQGRDLSILIKGRLPYENDNRIDDEHLLRQYFEDLGFECVCPEDFDRFEDQISFFYETKTLVSTTSSGFINACFMKPGSLMVELTTPLISFSRLGNGITQAESQGQEEIHHFYHAMSFVMEHGYISIPNNDRSAAKVISFIENNPHIKNALVN